MAVKNTVGRPKAGGHTRNGRYVAPKGEGQPIAIKDSKTGAIIAFKVPYPGTDEQTGKPKTLWARGKTIALAEAKRATILADRAAGVTKEKAANTVADFLDKWLENTVKPDCADHPRTYHSYEEVCRLYIKPHIGRIVLRELTPDDVDAMVAKLRTQENDRSKRRRAKAGGKGTPEYLSIRTISYARATLRMALNHAMMRRLVTYNVVQMTKPPKGKAKKVTPPSKEQLAQFLHAAKGHPYEAMFRVAALCGLRKGELLGLEWANINLDVEQGSLRVEKQLQRRKGFIGLVDPKTEKSQRTLPLDADTVKLLKRHKARVAEMQLRSTEWKGNPDGLVFVSTVGTALEPRRVNTMFKELLEKAGLPTTFPVHSLRHAFGTRMAEDGTHVATMMAGMGHSQPSQTLGTYVTLPVSALRGIAEMSARDFPADLEDEETGD